jgi:hypothetical protein
MTLETDFTLTAVASSDVIRGTMRPKHSDSYDVMSEESFEYGRETNLEL